MSKKEIPNNKSESYLVSVAQEGKDGNNYYVAQILYNDGKYNEKWDVEDKGYYLFVISVDYDTKENKVIDHNIFFSDIKLLIKCGRRSEKNFNLALDMLHDESQKIINEIEKEKEELEGKGVTDDEIKNFLNMFKEEYEKEMKKENGMKYEDKKEEKREKRDKDKVYLKDIAGHKEIKEEIMEIIDAFHNKEKYEKFGIKINLNMVFEGVSGTGKTMFAKAIANECGINFIHMSGSEFLDKYVGVGAKNVRQLYERARREAPCIVFIDEAECILQKRTSDSNGREQGQTLNQFLVELDGMGTTNDVITIVATNRIDMMDEAVLRPGRLTRHITIPPLDIEGRRELLKIYTEEKPLSNDVDLERIAKMTSGFVGAELSNLINESAIFAVRGNQEVITMDNFEKAYEKICTGLTSKTKKLSEKEKRITAIHEMGHALVSRLLENQKISKISILPRNNNTLGFVLYESDDEIDSYMQTKEDLENKIKTTLAGKIAEKIVFNHYTSGCSNDLQKTSSIAYNMVTKFGMSSLGSFALTSELCSQEKIYEEVNKIVGKCYKETKNLLKENLELLNKLADYLVEKEEITGTEFEKILNNALQVNN